MKSINFVSQEIVLMCSSVNKANSSLWSEDVKKEIQTYKIDAPNVKYGAIEIVFDVR